MKGFVNLLLRGGSVVLCTGLLFAALAIDLQKTSTGYTAVVDLSSVTVEQAGNGYLEVQIPGFYNNNPVGMAGLPETMFRLAIGKQKMIPEISVTILEKEIKALRGRIHPMQDGSSLDRPLSERPFMCNENYYKSMGKTESVVSVSEPFSSFGVPGVEVTIRPVTYNPQRNVITVATKFRLDITMPEGFSAIPSVSSKDGHTFVTKLFANYTVPKLRGERKDPYLIVHESQYAENSDFTTFVSFREALYDVSVVDLDDAGSSSSAVQSYINGLDPKPTYVLFVGDASSMPHFSSGPASYWQYSLEDGSDKYSDCFVGMFSVRNDEELGNIVHKTMYTEKNIDDYPKRATLYSTYDGDGHIHREVTYIKESYWEPGDFEIDWQVADNNSSLSASAATSAAKKAIADNASRYVCYQGHGGNTAFTPGISSSDVSSMSNDVVYPFVWGYACYTGTFTSKCFGDAWIASKGGACMYTGASVSSSTYQKCLNAGMARMAAIEPDLHTIGQIFFMGKHFVWDTTINQSGFNSSSKDQGSKMYNLFGDPALETITYNGTGISNADNALAGSGMQVKSFTSSTIALAVPTAGKYSCGVYSADGRKLQTVLANQHLSAGEQVVSWQGSDFPNGVYFVHIGKENNVAVNKFILLQ